MNTAGRARGALAFLLVCGLVAVLVPFHPAGALDGAWLPQESGVTDLLQDTAFADANKGFVTGTNGTILKTTDGGAAWERQYACTSGAACTAASGDKITQTLNGVSMLNGNEAYAVGAGATIIKTTDGGSTWTQQFACTVGMPTCTKDSPATDKVTATLNDVHFFATNKAVAVGASGTIVVTEDGSNWRLKASSTNAGLNDVWMANLMDGYAVGDGGTILKTINGGTTWSPQFACTTADACAQGAPGHVTDNLLAVYFTSAQQGYAAGANGTILTTTNGGTKWTKVTSNTTQVLNDVYFTGSEGYAVGTSGTILTSPDSGVTWTPMYACVATDPCVENSPDRISQTLNGLAVPAAKTGNAVGNDGTILRLGSTLSASPSPTTIVELAWTRQSSGVTVLLRSTSFVDADKGFAVGNDGTILSTLDGGATWERRFACSSGAACTSNSADRITTNLKAVSFLSATEGIAVGESGLILKTTDGGATWAQKFACQLTNPCTKDSGDKITATLNGVHFTAANAATIVGAGGTILDSADSGNAWVPKTSGSTQALNSVWFADPNNGLAVGDQGTIRKTINGGDTWTLQSACTSSANCTGTSNDRIVDALYGVMLTNSSNAFISGANGVILISSNGGQQWTKQVSNTNQILNDIYFVGSKGYAVGGSGTILTSSSGGTAWTAEFACATTNPCTASATDRILQTLHGISLASNGLGDSVGEAGVVLRLGNVPSTSPSPEPSPSASISPSPSPSPTIEPPEEIATFITIKYQKKKKRFKGDVAASEDTCWQSRPVVVKKVKRGKDRTVAKVTSNTNGVWKAKGFGKRKVRGKIFYAKAVKTVTEDFICSARSSQKLKF